MIDHRNMVKEYRRRNQYIRPEGALLFGSSFMTGINTGELNQYFELDVPTYNRSIASLSVFEADQALDDCVYALNPKKLFIQLGETDLALGQKNPEDILSQYEWLLYEIHSNLPYCRIYLVSLCSDKPEAAAFNDKLRQAAHQTGCVYIDISSACHHLFPEVKAFSVLNGYIKTSSFSPADAFCLKQV